MTRAELVVQGFVLGFQFEEIFFEDLVVARGDEGWKVGETFVYKDGS